MYLAIVNDFKKHFIGFGIRTSIGINSPDVAANGCGKHHRRRNISFASSFRFTESIFNWLSREFNFAFPELYSLSAF